MYFILPCLFREYVYNIKPTLFFLVCLEKTCTILSLHRFTLHLICLFKENLYNIQYIHILSSLFREAVYNIKPTLFYLVRSEKSCPILTAYRFTLFVQRSVYRVHYYLVFVVLSSSCLLRDKVNIIMSICIMQYDYIT